MSVSLRGICNDQLSHDDCNIARYKRKKTIFYDKICNRALLAVFPSTDTDLKLTNFPILNRKKRKLKKKLHCKYYENAYYKKVKGCSNIASSELELRLSYLKQIRGYFS